jgi:hypothetical protein
MRLVATPTVDHTAKLYEGVNAAFTISPAIANRPRIVPTP